MRLLSEANVELTVFLNYTLSSNVTQKVLGLRYAMIVSPLRIFRRGPLPPPGTCGGPEICVYILAPVRRESFPLVAFV